MTEKVGEIYFEVDIETQKMIQANQQAKKELDDLGSKAKGAADGIKTLETQVKSSASAVNQATAASKGFRGTMQQAGYQIQDFIVQVQGGQSALVAFSQQGSQLAGAFGPGGAMVGAFIALGSVLTGILMNAMGSTSNEMEKLEKAAESLNRIVLINSQGVAALSNDYARLAVTNAALATQLRDAAIAKYAAEIENARKAISGIASEQTSWWRNLSGGVASVTAAGNALDTLGVSTDNFRDAIQQADERGTAFRSSTQTILTTVGMMANKFDISEQSAFELVKRLNELAKNPTPENVTSISQAIAMMTSSTSSGRVELANFRDEITRAGASVAAAEQNIKDMDASLQKLTTAAQQANFDSISKQLEQQRVLLTQGKTAAQLYALEQQELTAEQKEELSAIIKSNAGLEEHQKKLKEAEQAAKRAATAHESVAQKLEMLRQKSELSATSTGELTREQAILQAQQSLGKAATQEQIRLAGEYAAKTYENAKAVKDLAQAEQGRKFATQEIAAVQVMPDAVTGAVQNPTAQIDLQEQQKLAALAKYQALDTQNTQLYEDAKTAIQQQAANARQQIVQNELNVQSQAISSIIGSVSQGFDGLANLAAGAAGESSGAYKAMFALSKGFAVAQAALNLQLAISQAMADPTALTPAQKFANYAAIASAGASLLSSIGSIAYSGGRKNGGPVSAGSMYQVGESGLPEIYQASTGKQYMIPGDNGTVISNKELQGSGNDVSGIQQTNYFTIQSSTGDPQEIANQMAKIAYEQSLRAIKDQKRPGGMLTQRK